MTSQQISASVKAETAFGIRALSDSECEAVSGGLIEPSSEEDEYCDGRFILRRYLFSDESGEEIVITASIHNDGGGYCATDSSWIPNFIENLFDGDKFFFSSGPFKYAMRGDNGTLCLYDQDSNLVGGYQGVNSTDPYAMSLTFTTNATTGEVAVQVGIPGTSVSGGSGTSGSSTAVTIFLGHVGQ